VLNRETGEPIWPVEERAVPASDVPGERAAATQPFSSLPPLSPQRLTAEDAWGPTPEVRAECRELIAGLRNEGTFTPPSLGGTLALPSNIGGAHWGGVAFDPERQLAIVPVNTIAAMVQLIPAEGFDREKARSESSRLGYEYTRMRGTPYYMRRRLLLSSSGTPCTPMPWGALVAMDLRNGREAWRVPLGTLPVGPASASAPPTGSPNLGGPIATAGGVVFIAATLDRAIRAFDVETGRELWKATLPAGGRATPMTYRIGGRQYLVIAAGGGKEFGAGDYIVAFALP
jgi:quinoprotein glucose dehydrogenase